MLQRHHQQPLNIGTFALPCLSLSFHQSLITNKPIVHNGTDRLSQLSPTTLSPLTVTTVGSTTLGIILKFTPSNITAGDKHIVSEVLREQKERLAGEAKVISENLSKLKADKSLTDEERKAQIDYNTEQYNKLIGAGSKWKEKSKEEEQRL
ncbi:Pai3p PWA37_003342 [Arxiozyma heterogenica]|uniref:Pai3p n=1 Tax=Arxiozyma heterogenica TaxID=278026 RepID=UPI002F0BF220